MDILVTIEHDPYGEATRGIRDIIAVALGEPYAGEMSEAEHANLIAFEEFLRERDNA